MKNLLMMVALTLLSINVDAVDTLKLNLDKSLEIALSENPTIMIAGKEIELQEYVRKETVGNLLPSLSTNGQYNRSVIKSTMDAGGGKKFSFEPTNTISGSASLTLPLFAPAVYRTLRMNEEQMRGAVEAARASRITLVNEVTKSYYKILLAQQSFVVLKASEANISQTVERTRNLFSQGLASEYDLLTAEVQLSNLQPTILQTQNAIKTAKQLFKMYLYLPQELDVELDGELNGFEASISENSNFDTDISLNTDLRQLEIQRNILQRQYKVAQASRMPTLAAFTNFQVMGRNKVSFGALAGGDAGGEMTKKETFEVQTPMSVGLQLSVPIFSGFTKVNRERQIKKSIEKLELQRDYMEQSVNVQVNTSINNILTAMAQKNANYKTVSQAQKGYEIAKTRYFAGVGTILELNTAELSLTQAKLNYSQAIYDYLSADADYRLLLGAE